MIPKSGGSDESSGLSTQETTQEIGRPSRLAAGFRKVNEREDPDDEERKSAMGDGEKSYHRGEDRPGERRGVTV